MKLSYDGIFPSIVRVLQCTAVPADCVLSRPHRNYEDSVHKLLVTTQQQSAALQAHSDLMMLGSAASSAWSMQQGFYSPLYIAPISRFTGFTASDAHYSPIFLSAAGSGRVLAPCDPALHIKYSFCQADTLTLRSQSAAYDFIGNKCEKRQKVGA